MAHILTVCARRFNGHELWTALGTIQGRGHSFDLISSSRYIEDEVTHSPNVVEKTIDDVEASEVEQYDGLMVVSGNMSDTEAYWKDERVLSYFNVAEEEQKQIAAICCSVPTARYAAKGKRVSFFPLVRSRELLTAAGAIPSPVAVTRDKNLVTAEHQMASQMWAEEFCNMLEGKPQQYFLSDSGFTPKGSERKPIKGLDRVQRRIERGRQSQSP